MDVCVCVRIGRWCKPLCVGRRKNTNALCYNQEENIQTNIQFTSMWNVYLKWLRIVSFFFFFSSRLAHHFIIYCTHHVGLIFLTLVEVNNGQAGTGDPSSNSF